MCENEMEKNIKALDDLVKIQCSDGNWNFNPYMHGMANGMILALSLFKGVDVIFLEPPEVWIYDKTESISSNNETLSENKS